ncbi:MAG: rRNA maturation RNase YbeY [Omnitrophica WOR_2 bacterium RIFCSPLOWO2_12_FULL_51_8]|nr:MAG: rRNA maturation RNase YbeY [Omnitrophica WOR_2 bacterium RIFCSPLOWO2_12_FULL_51_8]
MTITIKNFQKLIPINPKKVKSAILSLLREEGINSAEITASFTTGARIRELNRKFHQTDCYTDVLAFDLGGPAGKDIFGDIVVSADAAIDNAGIYKTSPAYELQLYVLHGLLHLLGYDDKTAGQSKIMGKKAEEILTKYAYS